jgi:hypothetical protein
MKYKTFRNLMIGGAVAAGAVGVNLAQRGRKETVETPRPVAPATKPTPAPPPDPAPPPVAVDPSRQPLRPIDRRVLERLKAPIQGADKVKDAFRSEAIKVNLYQDAGRSLPNRAKLDVDRDDRFDEKWTVDGERVTREISSADDDRTYDQRWLLDGDAWAREGAASAAPAPPPAPAPAAGVALRPMDTEILEKARAGISGERVKDATAGRPYKVSLYRDAGAAGVNRLKVDLDRDDRWDEKWTLEGDEVKRQVSPADDEKYTEEYRLRGGAWAR